MTRLRGITWEHVRGYDCMVAATAVYCQEHRDLQIDWEHRSLQAFADAPLESLTASYDLLVIDHPHVPAAATAGLLAPLDDINDAREDGINDGSDHVATALARLAEQSVGASHGSYRHRGRDGVEHQYGLASDAAAQVSVSRPDLITDPPTDWDGVLQLAAEGRVLWPAKPIDAFSSMISVAGSLGFTPAAEPGSFLPADQLEAVLDVLHRLAASVPSINLDQNPIEVSEALVASERACYVPLLFGYTNYARSGFRQHRLRYRDVPAGPAGVSGSLLGGAGIAVSARSAHRRQARDFALWVAGADAQRGAYFDAGGQPGNALAWQDDRLNTIADDFFRGTRRTLESAYLRPRAAGYLEFQDRASVLVNQALRGELTDRRLADRIGAAAAELLIG